MVSVKRGIVLVSSAVAFAAAPLLLASPASAQNCPYGTQPTRFEGVCTKSGSSGPAYLPPGVDAGGAVITGGAGELPRVNGVPCTEEHYGTCLAMQQNG